MATFKMPNTLTVMALTWLLVAAVSAGTVSKSAAANSDSHADVKAETDNCVQTSTATPVSPQAEVWSLKQPTAKEETQSVSGNNSNKNSHKRIITNWDDMEKIWHHNTRRGLSNDVKEDMQQEHLRFQRSFDDNVWSDAFDRDIATKNRPQGPNPEWTRPKLTPKTPQSSSRLSRSAYPMLKIMFTPTPPKYEKPQTHENSS